MSNKELSREVSQAIVAAFAYVAAADGEAHAVELDRFRDFLDESSMEPRAEMVASYTEMTRRFGDDFDATATRARAAISASPEAWRDLVLAAARAGVVADARIDDREEVVIREISELLGLDPDAA